MIPIFLWVKKNRIGLLLFCFFYLRNSINTNSCCNSNRNMLTWYQKYDSVMNCQDEYQRGRERQPWEKMDISRNGRFSQCLCIPCPGKWHFYYENINRKCKTIYAPLMGKATIPLFRNVKLPTPPLLLPTASCTLTLLGLPGWPVTAPQGNWSTCWMNSLESSIKLQRWVFFSGSLSFWSCIKFWLACPLAPYQLFTFSSKAPFRNVVCKLLEWFAIESHEPQPWVRDETCHRCIQLARLCLVWKLLLICNSAHL